MRGNVYFLQIPDQLGICFVFIFREIRAAVVEQNLRKLEVERLNKDDVQKMQWEVLEAKIGNWIHSMRIAVRVYYMNLYIYMAIAITRAVCIYILVHYVSSRQAQYIALTIAISALAIAVSFIYIYIYV